MRITEKIAIAGLAALFGSGVVQACGGTVVFEEASGQGGGDGDGDGDGAGSGDGGGRGSPTSTSASPAANVSTGAGVSVGQGVTSVGVTVGVSSAGVTTGGVPCPFTNDGVCDEPDVCPPGTDADDCAFAGAPCAPDCAGDPGCAVRPPSPGNACIACVAQQAASLADCATSAAFSDTCQSDEECADYVNCVISGNDLCVEDFPHGAALAQALLLRQCGSCGDGTIE